MSTAHIVADRLAGSAGRTAWSEAEAAHLASCADCRLELELVAVARRLGTVPLAGFDPKRVATGVLLRLATAPAELPARAVRHPVRWLAALAAAAAVMLVVSRRAPSGPADLSDRGHGGALVVSVLHELDGLSEPQLEEMLQSMPPAIRALDHVEMAPLSDLNATDLERVLRSMEEP